MGERTAGERKHSAAASANALRQGRTWSLEGQKGGHVASDVVSQGTT